MSNVCKQDIVLALKELRLSAGDICLFHSSFKSLGTVEGGAGSVIAAFEEVIGKEGTLVAPTLSNVDFTNSYKTWYMDKPSGVGYLTEFFRKQMYVYRSDHATHSVAARGKDAYELTFEHGWRGPHLCPFGEYAFADSSPWVKMDKKNAKVVFIGVTMKFNTMKHVVEGRAAEYFLSKVKDEKRRAELAAELKTFEEFESDKIWLFYNSENMQARLDEMGLLSHAKCGDAELIMADAGRTNAAAFDILVNEYEDWFKPAVVEWIKKCLNE